MAVAADDGCALSPRSGGGAVATDALVIGPVTLPRLAGATVFGREMVSVGVIARPNCHLASASSGVPSLRYVRRRWSWDSVRALPFFKLAAAPRIDNVVTAALLPHQPDQLRCRHDRHDNGETYRRRNGTRRKFFNDFSRVLQALSRSSIDYFRRPVGVLAT